MSQIEERLKTLNICLPQAPKSLANYMPTHLCGNQLFLSGQLPFIAGQEPFIGKVGIQIGLPEAQKAARLCGYNLLSQAKNALGSLDRIKKVIKITVFVAADAAFTDLPRVADGLSDLLVEIFQENGRHTRSTVGVNVLPMNAPVEAEAIFEI